ncbi:MAG: DUF305 domain-containing protein [Bacteroidetes bacterium]|nr:DUF305 domain-containing protein [Bacteroidota bacterium]
MPTRASISLLLLFGLCISTGSLHAQTLSSDTSNASTDLEALFWARQDSARTSFTDADVAFMAGMIGHHAQALVMSRLAPTNGANTQVQTLAARIINAQTDEIVIMQRWLRQRGQPVPEVHIEGLNLMIHGGGEHDHLHMPGMLTDQQLHELDEAQGAAFDRLFLTYMIQHHSGAVTMVDDLFATDGAALDQAAFKLASDINVDQITEIARMELMLTQLPEPEPGP